MRNFRRFILMIFAVISSDAFAELYLHTNLKCVSSAERREIHLYQNNDETASGPVCKVDYLKQGNVETLWSAQESLQYCASKVEDLAERLENVGFKCISTAVFTKPKRQE